MQVGNRLKLWGMLHEVVWIDADSSNVGVQRIRVIGGHRKCQKKTVRFEIRKLTFEEFNRRWDNALPKRYIESIEPHV